MVDATALARGLFPHQIEGVAFLIGRRRAILADDMGLGKTRQAIVALGHAAPGGPYLVVCPASVKHNWAREIAIAVPGSDVAIVGGGERPGAADWTIINYDILPRHVDALLERRWAGLVFDEAHYLKNHTSIRSRLARRLTDAAAHAGARSVYLLTGTPLTNRPRDLFVLLQLAGHPLGRSFLGFAKRYCAAERNDFGWQTRGASNVEELTVQLHGVMLRRSKDEVLSLPPKLRTWLPIDVPKGTGVSDMRKVMELLASDEKVAPDSTVDDRRLRGRLLGAVTKARQRLAGAKLTATKEFVDGAVAQGEKVIVFSCFEEPIRALADTFGSQAVVLTGRTPASERQSLVDRFQQDAGVRVLIANIVAGGVGLNLTEATQVVFNDLDWVPANHWQAEDRAYRIGQTRTVNVTYVVAARTLDEFVQAVLERKSALITAVVDGTALAPDEQGDVLDALQRAIRSVTSEMGAGPGETDAMLERLLAWARDESAKAAAPSPAPGHGPGDVEALRRALAVLARALAPPARERYRFASSSKPGVEYELTVDSADVVCSCAGFEYRGQCRHTRDLKAALAAGQSVPAGYRRENEGGSGIGSAGARTRLRDGVERVLQGDRWLT